MKKPKKVNSDMTKEASSALLHGDIDIKHVSVATPLEGGKFFMFFTEKASRRGWFVHGIIALRGNYDNVPLHKQLEAMNPPQDYCI